MKIGLDCDGTGDSKNVRDEIIKLIKAGHEVEIVTTRFEDPSNYFWYSKSKHSDLHKELFDFAKLMGIKYHFTNMKYKASYLNDNNFDYHIDDNYEESFELTTCKFIPVEQVEQFVENLLNHETENNSLQSS